MRPEAAVYQVPAQGVQGVFSPINFDLDFPGRVAANFFNLDVTNTHFWRQIPPEIELDSNIFSTLVQTKEPEMLSIKYQNLTHFDTF